MTAAPESSSPKSICYVITKANFGGAQRYVYDLATTAAEEGHAVSVVYGQDGLLREKLEASGVPLIRVPSLGRDVRMLGDMHAFIDLWKIFREKRPDVVHLNSSKVGALGALAARLAGVPNIVFTAHGWASTENRPDWQKAVIASIHWTTVLLSHRTIAVSEHTKREMNGFPFIARKMIVIHNAQKSVPLLPRQEAKNEVLSLAPRLAGYGVWIATGTELHQNKGIDVAIQGFAEIASDFPDSALVVIGEGEERSKLEALLEALNMKERVFLLGFFPDASRIMKAFDIFMLPSRKEGFPYIILEAGLAGIPMIASSVGGIPEAIKDMETGILIHPRSPSEVSHALASLLKNPDKRGRFGEAFRKDIRARFSFAHMWKLTSALYARGQ